ncbi:Cupredoxin [Gymnopus androsaceus JB14]|uniref:Cupredoxin n=1 Tax=Gymnopus androsaceus JB14 TaxID=1447944 RepID=A0A6A4I9B8_9AGAR|nr:Cupredoxin [Gymnopus androsaceus JB14]
MAPVQVILILAVLVHVFDLQILVSAATVTRDLFVVNENLAPDGFSRSTVVGDSFQLNVTDLLTDSSMNRSTSIHWHGLFQKTTNYVDGVAFVSQCPIVPNNSFLYNFTVPDQAGTFWYHSHLSVQYCDGLRGPFVIYDDAHDRSLYGYDIDDDSTVITIGDWYHDNSLVLFAAKGPQVPVSTLINGLGRSTLNSTTPLAVVKVDGNLIAKQTVDLIVLYPGQRYSFILLADQDPSKTYGIRALYALLELLVDTLRIPLSSGDPNGTVQQNPIIPLNESELVPLLDPAPPEGVNPFVVNITLGLIGHAAFSMNDVQWMDPPVPVLLQIISGAQTPQSLLPSGSVYTLPPNQTIEITLVNPMGGAPHPFHLHGHAFSVVKPAGGPSNYVNPVRRDVAAVAANDITTIRFVTDNPGPWMLHWYV